MRNGGPAKKRQLDPIIRETLSLNKSPVRNLEIGTNTFQKIDHTPQSANSPADQAAKSNNNMSISQYSHPKDPELIRTDRQLPSNIEEEIKDGFFELKQKFKTAGASSIYISHVVLHEKHPILKKVRLETLKTILMAASVIYLDPGQVLYRSGAEDPTIYIVLFGKIALNYNNGQLGSVNLGWTIGEEILFDRHLQVRSETAVATNEACLIGITKAKLGELQESLLQQRMDDYYVIESVFKGNFLIKDEWRRHCAVTRMSESDS